jgi:hypothetical protein
MQYCSLCLLLRIAGNSLSLIAAPTCILQRLIHYILDILTIRSIVDNIMLVLVIKSEFR